MIQFRMLTMLLLTLFGCESTNPYTLQVEGPGLSVSPSLETLADLAPGEVAEVSFNLDNTGAREGNLSVEFIEYTGVGLSADLSEIPDVLVPGERIEVVVTYAPEGPGVAIGYIQATVLGADECGEAWAVVRANAVDDSCDPDDLDCDGQTATSGDCDDDEPFNGIALPEICDGKDNNCDGTADPDCRAGQCGHPPPP